MHKFSLLILLFPFLFTDTFSQTWEIGVFGGSSAYMGDINPVNPVKVRNAAFGAQFKRNFNPYWSLKLGYMHGKLEAYDSESDNQAQRDRNLSFYSSLNELSLQAEFNFFKYVPSLSDKRYTPYLFGGVSAFTFNPKTLMNGDEYNLRDWATEGQDIQNTYKTYAFSVPYGAGVKYNISGQWSLIGEIGYRTAFTDYLDDVSKTYPLIENEPDLSRKILSDKSFFRKLPDGSTAYNFLFIDKPGTQRGDYRKRDTYMFIGLTLTFTFISDKCPVVL